MCHVSCADRHEGIIELAHSKHINRNLTSDHAVYNWMSSIPTRTARFRIGHRTELIEDRASELAGYWRVVSSYKDVK